MSPDEQQPIVIHPEVQGEGTDDVAREWTVRGHERRAQITTTPEGEPSAPPPELAAPGSKRAFSLDALRGLFLILMTFGFTISRPDFPVWMYHRQMPPPTEAIVNIAGISWRDLAYGAFLFTMSAALPLTLSRRIQKGETEIGIVVAAIRRYLLLLFFALLVAHSNPFHLGYTNTARTLAILGFVIMALVFTRRRPDWDEKKYRVINGAGWVLAVAFLAFTPMLYGKTFSFQRADEIITGLAVAALTGSVIWYFTRENLTARLAVLAIAVALYLGAKEDGWLQQWWYSSPAHWAFEPSRFVLLTIAIPGTIAGDVILRWMRSPDAESSRARWTTGRVAAITLLSAAFTPVVVVGLYHRQVAVTTQVVLAMLIAGLFLTWRPTTAAERMIRSLFVWAGIWLAIGLFLEPFEGGIKKVPDTLSYYFTITGTTTMLLIALTALVDVLKRQELTTVLIDVGHNPLLTYVLFTILINSALELVPPLRGVLNGSPSQALVRYAIDVLLVVVIARAASRRRIYWRT